MINKKKILLYSPSSFKDVRVWEKAKSVPVALLAVASMIPLDKYDVKIYEGFSDMQSELLDNLEDVLCVGISAITGVQLHHGLQIAGKVKDKHPEIPIIWGGYHPSILPEQTVSNNNVDIVVRGYGERTFAELVENIANNKPLDSVLGITFKKNGNIYSNPDREIEDVNNFPPLPYHLIDLNQFILVKNNKRTLEYVSSRGCPFNCGFCAEAIVYKRKWNCLSSKRVIEDLEWLSKHYDFEAIRFLDSNLFVNEERIKEICFGIINLGLNFAWDNCNGTASVLRKYAPETWELLRKVNCKNILVGAESGFPPALAFIKKPSTVEDTMAVVNITKKFDISGTYSFMFGFPYDLSVNQLRITQRDELMQTMRIICEFIKIGGGAAEILLFKFTPYPGSQLFRQSLKMGFVPPENLEEWGTVTLDEVNLPWVDRELNELFNDCLFQVDILVHGDRYLKWLLSLLAIQHDSTNICVKRVQRLLETAQSKIINRIDKGILKLPFSLRILKYIMNRARSLRNGIYSLNKHH